MSRINFLFVLIIGLTACAPNTAPTPSPVVTSSPIASIPPTSTATEIPSIPNPIDPENMDLLTRAGYLWDEQTGSLKNKDGNTILIFEDGKWVDESGVESTVESLTINLTDGVDFDGNPIVVMLTRTVEIDGEMETQVYGPLSEEWFKPADILASQAMMDQNIPEVSLTNWGDFRKISFEDIPIVTQQFAESHKLLESQWLFLREWPENVREPKLQCVKRDVLGNIWVLTQYPLGVGSHYTGNIYYQREPGERPAVWSTDGIDQNLSVVRFQNSAGEWVIEQGIQYYVKGQTVVLSVRHIGARANPSDPEFTNTQQFLSNPEYQVVEPRCSLPNIRPLMPQTLRAKMAELDSNPEVLARDAGYYQIDFVTMAKLQGISFEGTGAEWWEQGYSFEKRWLEAYLRDEADPLFDEQFPERKK